VAEEGVIGHEEALGGLEAAAAEVALAEADLCVVEDELHGYVTTSLERRAVAAMEAVSEAIRRDPGILDGPILEGVLRCALQLQLGVDSYRARMLKAAGDYADESSPIARGLDHLFHHLKEAVKILDRRGKTPLALVAPAVLNAQLHIVAGERYDIQHEVYRYLLDEDMATAKERVFADLAGRDVEAVEEQALELATAPLARDREAAVRHLASLGSLVGRAGKTRVLEALLGALGDPDSCVAGLVRAILASSGEAAVGPLLDVLCDPTRAALHERALSALEEVVAEDPPYGPPAAQVIARLFDALPAAEKALHERIRRTLSRLEPADERGQLELLVERMHDPRPVVAEAASLLLSSMEIHDAGLVPRLEELLADPVWQLRYRAARCLNDLGPAGRAVLREALAGGDAALRSLILVAISGLEREGSEFLPAVIEASRDADVGVRLAAIGALEKAALDVRDDEDLQRFLRDGAERCLAVALEDPDGRVRCTAAEALHNLAPGEYPLSKVMLPILADGPRDLRVNALGVIGRCRAAAGELLVAIEAAAQGPDEGVAEVARYTLEVLRDPL
jgi:hypothetical protein